MLGAVHAMIARPTAPSTTHCVSMTDCDSHWILISREAMTLGDRAFRDACPAHSALLPIDQGRRGATDEEDVVPFGRSPYLSNGAWVLRIESLERPRRSVEDRHSHECSVVECCETCDDEVLGRRCPESLPEASETPRRRGDSLKRP